MAKRKFEPDDAITFAKLIDDLTKKNHEASKFYGAVSMFITMNAGKPGLDELKKSIERFRKAMWPDFI